MTSNFEPISVIVFVNFLRSAEKYDSVDYFVNNSFLKFNNPFDCRTANMKF